MTSNTSNVTQGVGNALSFNSVDFSTALLVNKKKS